MDTLIIALPLLTIGAVVAFALLSKRKTEAARDSDAPKSTLAADAPDTRS
ncbi:MAG: hypothetical protein AAFR93_08320 [Pseudomonadota bacterium]